MGETVTITADAALQQVIDAVETSGGRVVAVVDGTGRTVGTIDPETLPHLFDAGATRVSGTPRQRRRRDRLAAARARDLMVPAAPTA